MSDGHTAAATAIDELISGVKTSLDVQDIQSIIPHRYPFLLLDRVTEIRRKEKIVALKNVTNNEPFFQGHFPGYPIMPGVLVVEAMAQAGAVLLLTEVEDRQGKLMVFTGIERARFRKPVVPGDQLRIEVGVLAFRRYACKISCEAFVGEKLVCEAVLTCQLVERPAPSGAPNPGNDSQ
jgi:3-hydroxyacyl-[acyl-carrier-protein] dehydratase